MPDKLLDPEHAVEDSNDPPPPTTPPPTKRNEGYKRDNSEGGGPNIAPEENGPPHWTRYVEAVCAIALVLITGTYTFYAAKQTKATQDAANAALCAAKTADASLILSRQQFAASQAAVLQPRLTIRSQPTGKAIELKTSAPLAQMETFIQVDLINAGKIAATHVNGAITSKTFGRIAINDATIPAQSPSPEYQSGFITRRFKVAVVDGPFFDSRTIGHERITIDIQYFNGIENIKASFCYTHSQVRAFSGNEWEECDQKQR